jgi:hypothetical protein
MGRGATPLANLWQLTYTQVRDALLVPVKSTPPNWTRVSTFSMIRTLFS